MDHACNLVCQHGLVTKVIDDIYNPREHNNISSAQFQVGPAATPGNAPVVATVVAVHPPALTLTLSPSELQALRSSVLPPSLKLHLSLSEIFCVEIATCLHSSVALRALSTKFFILAIRLVLRFEAHAAVTAEVPTPSFPKSALMALLQQQNGPSNISSTPMSTPVKGVPSYAPVPSPMASNTVQSPVASASIDDLVLLASDLHTLTEWLGATFGPLAETALRLPAGGAKVRPSCQLRHPPYPLLCLSLSILTHTLFA